MTVTLETRDFFYPKINGGNEKKKENTRYFKLCKCALIKVHHYMPQSYMGYPAFLISLKTKRLKLHNTSIVESSIKDCHYL